jgi:hypothetical protein
MKKTFKFEVLTGIQRTKSLQPVTITENDLKHLPPIVNKYLHYAGVVGKEKVINMRVVFEGRIRSNPEDGWMKLTAEQYSFFDGPTRIFYIKARKLGFPVLGLHLYKNQKASMVIKLLGLIKVVDAKGPQMDQGETVTVLNDMCLLAPSTLIDKSIQWESVNSLSAKAIYTNGKITIGATLSFNQEGKLLNFVSNDRFETDGKTYKSYPWLTPIKEYGKFHGFLLPSEVSTDSQRPDKTFTYGEWKIRELEYNCKDLL